MRNFLVRLLNGDIPLLHAFWIFGIGIGVTVYASALQISNMPTLWVRFPWTATLAVVLPWLAVIYIALAWYAVWRSAERYPGSGLYAWGAKIVMTGAVFGVVMTLLDIQQISDEEKFEQKVAELNASLPKNINQNVRLNKVSLLGEDMRFEHSYIKLAAADLKITSMEMEKKRTDLLNTHCKTPQLRNLLERRDKLIFQYKDVHGEVVQETTISLEGCARL